jgi:hypothetical protein
MPHDDGRGHQDPVENKQDFNVEPHITRYYLLRYCEVAYKESLYTHSSVATVAVAFFRVSIRVLNNIPCLQLLGFGLFVPPTVLAFVWVAACIQVFCRTWGTMTTPAPR